MSKKTVKSDKPKCNETYRIHHPTQLKLLTRLQLGSNHLNNHNSRDRINSLSSCSLRVENNVHYFLHCHHFLLQRETLMNNIKSTDRDIINETDLVNI